MNNIYDKLSGESILDSEIIQEIESAKSKNPEFDINLGCDGDNRSLLMHAVWKDRKELVEYLLLDPRIDVNHKCSFGNTAFYLCGDISILKLLLNHRDLDVNIQNNSGRTELHRVCFWGRKALVKEYLLDARVNTSIRDDDGNTARDEAITCGHSDVAKIVGNSGCTSLLRIPNNLLLYDIVRMIIEEYT